MKRRFIAAVLVSALAVASLLCACSNPAEEAADVTMDMYDKEQQAQDALDSFNDAIQSNDEAADAIFNESRNTDGFSFTVNGVKVAPDMDTATFLSDLGEPLHYNEVQSCAFPGMSKIYTYTSFVITTYPQGDKDFVSNIELKDDTVTTEEGIYLSESKDKVLETYGDGYTEKDGVFIYEKGNDRLQFIFQNDELASIEYVTKVLDEE